MSQSSLHHHNYMYYFDGRGILMDKSPSFDQVFDEHYDKQHHSSSAQNLYPILENPDKSLNITSNNNIKNNNNVCC